MDRKEARRRAEIMMAFANGSDVQFYNGVTKQWEDIRPECVLFESTTKYRVKPESKYRPFKTQEECWNEMLKHQPFGWVKNIETGDLCNISNIYESEGCSKVFLDTCAYTFSSLLNEFTFIDGTPFGIKEE